MKDRLPVNPGRVLIAPENGGTAYYATMTRADNPTEEGTPLNKATMLKDATAAVFGLDEYAVPEDVFAFLGKYNQHWWEVTHGISRNVYSEKRTEVTSRTNLSYYSGFPFTFSYSKSIAIDPHDGTVSLVDPQTVVLHTDGKEAITTVCAALASQAPIYFKSDYGHVADCVFYAPEGATAPAAGSNELGAGSYTFYMMKHSQYTDFYLCIGNEDADVPAYAVTTTAKWVTAGEITYVHGATRDAYTDGVTEDFDSYVYLGVPFQNMPTAARIAHGSYVGTGKAGADNPTTLTFGFVPKIVFISAVSDIRLRHDDGFNQGYAMLINGVIDAYVQQSGTNASNTVLNIEWNGASVSMYHTYSPPYPGSQFNSSGKTYYYVALG